MQKILKVMKDSLVKRCIAMVLLICMMVNINVDSACAAKEYYYKGYDILYGGSGKLVYTKTWYGGFMWLTEYTEKYYLTNSYMRCLTYYHDAWIANQGQTVSLTTSKTVTRSVSAGVSNELGISGVIASNIGTNYSSSVSTTYSSSLGLSYNLSNFKYSSYKIASMGFYDKFTVKKYKDGSYQSSYTRYAYEASYGQEIRLVYRY